MGFDVSGVVESVGKGVERFKVGDLVFSYLPISSGGAYAEYVVAPETAVAAKPKSIDHVHAAAVPLAALTAWQALFDKAGLKAGQTVLIHAGSGGVGHFAVQLAKAKGAKVIATSSAKNLDFLEELGADQAIDYKTQKFEELVKDVDVVLDPIGGETLARSYQVVKPGGFLVSIVEPPSPEKLEARGIRGAVFLVQPDAKELAEIGALIEAGKVKPVVSETYPLADARKAQESSQTGHARGKIVLVVVK
jgi:NADPH:quinone reductase-like Zn-dependent oxidoreductase